MKVSHLLYKVNNLDSAVCKFRNEGFKVEYGKSKDPYNALIYFSNGPYVELYEPTNLPTATKIALKLIRKEKVVQRMEIWKNQKEGFIGLALENYETNFKHEKKILKKQGQKYFEIKNKRRDTKNRLLKYKVLFPDEIGIPFLMTYFTIDPKPKNFVHPNGITQISDVSFGTTEELIPLIKELCDDTILNLFEGDNKIDIQYKSL